MARPLRIEYEGALYHLTARGNERQDIFRDDRDREEFLERLQRQREQYGTLPHAYVLMTNHYHVLLETPEANLSRAMHSLQTGYTVYFNRRHGRVGHLFQGRYKAILVEKEAYLLEVSRYLHLNPVRAGMVVRPEEYRWSSYRGYLDGRVAEPWVERSWIYDQFSSEVSQARRAYQAYVEEALGAPVRNPLAEATAQVILGGAAFVKRVQEWLAGESPDPQRPALRALQARPTLAEIVAQVTAYYGVPEEALGERRRHGNRPRAVAMYLTRRYTATGLAEVAEFFGGVSPSAVTQTVARLARQRGEDRSVAKELQELEAAVKKLNVKT
jgi:REP element-mobilizing transposase RayT